MREIIVNAFAHFDPSYNSDIKIEFYPDRVEIASPGSLYKTTMKEILSGRQSFRNPGLINVLSKFNYIENYATGLKKTAMAYKKYKTKPIFEATEHFFVVILANVNFSNKIEEEVDDLTEMMKREDSDYRRIIEEIKRDPYISRNELSEKIGKSKSTVYRKIVILKSAGYILPRNKKSGGHWKIIKIPEAEMKQK